MSLADLSARIYTIKSRKNVPFSTALASMVREDLSLRYSMFNIVKSLTGSEVIAQVAEARYGFKTPLQKEEDKSNKKRADRLKKFQQFTANSLATLNNKINTLAALTQRNTILIENLYNDLGHFRNQRKFTKRDLNRSAPKVPIRSKTVKYQIDQIKAELTALQMVTIGSKATKKLKKSAEGSDEKTAAVAAAAAIGGAATIGSSGKSPPGTPPPPPPGGEEGGFNFKDAAMIGGEIVGTYAGFKALDKMSDWWKARKIPPTATPAAKSPVWNVGTQRWQDPTTGRFIKTPKPATPSATVSKAPGMFSRGLSATGRFLGFAGRAAGAAGNVALGGYAMYDIISGKTAGKIIANYNEVAKQFGLEFIKGPGGTTVGYRIDGVEYTPSTIPQEYKNILDAIGPDKRASARAQAIIAADEMTYRMLETREGRNLVLPPPPTEITDPYIKAALAGRVALDIQEPILPETLPVAAPSADSTIQKKKPKSKTQVTTPAPTPSVIAPVSPPPPASTPTNVSGIPIDFSSYSAKIGLLESSNNYTVVNSLGYLGKYQFGALALQDVGLVKKGTSLKGLDNPDNWNIKGGKEAFLNNPKLQEQTFIKYTTMNFRTLQRIGVLNVQSPPDQIAGYLAASHLLGPGGAKDLMKGIVSTDAYGTKSSKYYVAGVETQRTYMAAITTIPKLDYSSGETVSVPPPPMLAATTPSESSMQAEIIANAALATNKVMQDVIVGLGGKVSDIDKQLQLDKQFPVVRNVSLA